MKIGIQGEAGSYSAEAAAGMVPAGEQCSFSRFKDVYQALAEGGIDAAILPFENTLVGSIGEQYDLLAQYAAEIEQESILRIEHQLIGMPGSSLGKVWQVFSHPIALRQCRKFFERHPELAAREFYDTAGSVAHVLRENNMSLAAIASRQAAAQYGGEILEADLQDDGDNCTRFWMLRRPGEAACGQNANQPYNKISILLEVAHQPGALSRALEEFASMELNLMKIEPRPIPGKPFRHRFFADFGGEALDAADTAIAALRSRGEMVRILGRYRAAPAPAASLAGAG